MAAFIWVEFFWCKYFNHQKTIITSLYKILYALYVTEAFTISLTDFDAGFAHFSTVLIKSTMNVETADANTMLSTEEYHMVECVAIASHLLAWGQLGNQARGQVSPFLKQQYFLNNLISRSTLLVW